MFEKFVKNEFCTINITNCVLTLFMNYKGLDALSVLQQAINKKLQDRELQTCPKAFPNFRYFYACNKKKYLRHLFDSL